MELGTHKFKDNCSHSSEATVPGILRTQRQELFNRPRQSLSLRASPKSPQEQFNTEDEDKDKKIARFSFLIYLLTAPRMQRVRPTAWLD